MRTRIAQLLIVKVIAGLAVGLASSMSAANEQEFAARLTTLGDAGDCEKILQITRKRSRKFERRAFFIDARLAAAEQCGGPALFVEETIRLPHEKRYQKEELAAALTERLLSAIDAVERIPKVEERIRLLWAIYDTQEINSSKYRSLFRANDRGKRPVTSRAIVKLWEQYNPKADFDYAFYDYRYSRGAFESDRDQVGARRDLLAEGYRTLLRDWLEQCGLAIVEYRGLTLTEPSYCHIQGYNYCLVRATATPTPLSVATRTAIPNPGRGFVITGPTRNRSWDFDVEPGDWVTLAAKWTPIDKQFGRWEFTEQRRSFQTEPIPNVPLPKSCGRAVFMQLAGRNVHTGFRHWLNLRGKGGPRRDQPIGDPAPAAAARWYQTVAEHEAR